MENYRIVVRVNKEEKASLVKTFRERGFSNLSSYILFTLRNDMRKEAVSN